MAQTRSSDCLHDCSDPTWGGEGTCNTSSDPPVCLCDDGFAWREDMGHAGCYPRWKLVAGYVALAVTSFLTSAVLVWQANKFRYLPAGLSASRRRILTRLRALISCRYASFKKIVAPAARRFCCARFGWLNNYRQGYTQSLKFMSVRRHENLFATHSTILLYVRRAYAQHILIHTARSYLQYR